METNFLLSDVSSDKLLINEISKNFLMRVSNSSVPQRHRDLRNYRACPINDNFTIKCSSDAELYSEYLILIGEYTHSNGILTIDLDAFDDVNDINALNKRFVSGESVDVGHSFNSRVFSCNCIVTYYIDDNGSLIPDYYSEDITEIEYGNDSSGHKLITKLKYNHLTGDEGVVFLAVKFNSMFSDFAKINKIYKISDALYTKETIQGNNCIISYTRNLPHEARSFSIIGTLLKNTLCYVFDNEYQPIIPSVGDTIIFGNYPQEITSPDPIEWTVLDVDTTNRRALLISKKVLDCQKYNENETGVSWQTCSLRTWLNNTFKETAFNNAEKNLIYKSHIETDGNTTEDYVFCLSIQEASNMAYFADDASRKALATQRAIDDGAFTDSGYAHWWLRSPRYVNNRAALVHYGGEISYGVVNLTDVGVRPVLWFKY